jgi:hypothetical protein
VTGVERPATRPAVTREARLVIAEHLNRRDNLCGAWWPRSRFVAEELPALLSVASRRFRTILGVTLTLAEWPGSDIGHQYCGPRTKLNWYGLEARDLAVLHVEGARRINLLVIPPDTAESVAISAMLMASTPGNSRTPQQLLVDAAVTVTT